MSDCILWLKEINNGKKKEMERMREKREKEIWPNDGNIKTTGT
jgi:hypothetical protein